MSSGITREDLDAALDHALNKKRRIDNDIHFDDHEFLKILKSREARRERRVEKFKLSLIGGMALAFVGFLTWVGQIVVTAFSHGQHP